MLGTLHCLAYTTCVADAILREEIMSNTFDSSANADVLKRGAGWTLEEEVPPRAAI